MTDKNRKMGYRENMRKKVRSLLLVGFLILLMLMGLVSFYRPSSFQMISLPLVVTVSDTSKAIWIVGIAIDQQDQNGTFYKLEQMRLSFDKLHGVTSGSFPISAVVVTDVFGNIVSVTVNAQCYPNLWVAFTWADGSTTRSQFCSTLGHFSSSSSAYAEMIYF